jgi:ribonucleoside-diphosphate reductase beta chain
MNMTKVFNTEKTPDQYRQKSPLFFGPDPGLFDTVNKHYPKIWAIYKTMKSLDWSEDEFDYTQCNLDFKNCPKPVYDMMIRTLAWQWEADSVASRSIAPVLAPFISDSSLWAAWQRISDNEVVHAATYSEIVRMSFDDPEKVLSDILSVKESLIRLTRIKQVFDDAHKASHQYALGLITEDEAYDKLFMTVVALLLLERIQFMASFAITFTICSSNLFQPIGKAVQKIAQDELEVHVELDKEVLRVELATERGRASYERQKQQITELCNEVVNSELVWTDYLFSEGRELVGVTAPIVKSWVLFNARDVYKFLDLETDLKFPRINPMPHMEDWINIGKTQAAPQEQDNNQYKVGAIVRDDSSTSFDVDF